MSGGILPFFRGGNSPPRYIYNWDSFLRLLACLPLLHLTFVRLGRFLEQSGISAPESVGRFCTEA